MININIEARNLDIKNNAHNYMQEQINKFCANNKIDNADFKVIFEKNNEPKKPVKSLIDMNIHHGRWDDIISEACCETVSAAFSKSFTILRKRLHQIAEKENDNKYKNTKPSMLLD
ncbi:MAG TPA: HPF/RaiA family ribosome-associated protein [Candidatus Megaira endosymbiont of Hartmannula sinica]|nr:HPF/RaiA family ribosome-associated protein [Candidatus Megaera endosymbiont of Hartmannula sinica]